MSNQLHTGEEQRRKQVKIRAKEGLVEQFDEWCEDQDVSRSEGLRDAMRSRVNGEGIEWQTPRQPPRDDERLATAYETLCAVANQDGVVREGTALSVVATKLGLSKAEIQAMALKPLAKRGYLSRESNVYGATSYRINGDI